VKEKAKPRPRSGEKEIERLRARIAGIDQEILGLLRQRMDSAEEVGRLKAEVGLPIVVRGVEERVLDRARRHARECGVSSDVMNQIFQAILRGSVERQHRVGVATRVRRGGRVLIVGGGGAMGRWFASFLRLVGHSVGSCDTAYPASISKRGWFRSIEEVPDLDAYDFILVSAPLGRTPEVLEEVVARLPRTAIVVEIASIKSGLAPVLKDASEHGVRVISLHPMFGPGKSPYEPLTFVLAHQGDPAREKKSIEQLLRHPYTAVVPMPLEHHDRLMGWLLGLAHLTGIVFGAALARSRLDPRELQACASTTFSRQASTAVSILSEDPALYLDIQRLNPHRAEVYAATREALDEIVRLVEDGDLPRFRAALDVARGSLP
jgi:chorismate mutase/prephenate dehydrogenase